MKIDYSKIQETYDRMNEIINDIVENMMIIKKCVDNLSRNDEWNGKGYRSYCKKLTETYAQAGVFIKLLQQISKKLLKVIENYQQVDQILSRTATVSKLGGNSNGI